MPKYHFGAKLPLTDLRDYKLKIAGSSTSNKLDDLPNALWLTHPDIKNQGNVNSCVAHVAAEIEEFYNIIQENDDSKLSVGHIYGTRYDYNGEGMYLRDALKTLKSIGVATDKEFPFNEEVPKQIELVKSHGRFRTADKNKISSYFKIDVSKAEDIKYALFKYGPVMASIKWYDDFTVDKNTAIMSSTQNCNYGYHCVMIYGYNEDGFFIQNSWGENWGKQGIAIYPYKFKFEEAWGIIDNNYCNDSTDDIKTSENISNQPIIRFIIKIVNYIINVFKRFKSA